MKLQFKERRCRRWSKRLGAVLAGGTLVLLFSFSSMAEMNRDSQSPKQTEHYTYDSAAVSWIQTDAGWSCRVNQTGGEVKGR